MTGGTHRAGSVSMLAIQSSIEHAKNYIVCFLADVEQGEPIDQDELHCFWDNYELYKAMGGNSYVHDKVEKLKAQGKL